MSCRVAYRKLSKAAKASTIQSERKLRQWLGWEYIILARESELVLATGRGVYGWKLADERCDLERSDGLALLLIQAKRLKHACLAK